MASKTRSSSSASSSPFGGAGAAAGALTLNQLCEPLFLYICRLNRAARKGGSALELAQVRSEVLGILKQIQEEAGEQGKIEQFQKIRKPLIYFVDSMISESPLPFAEAWNKSRLAHLDEDFGGDETFFVLLDKTLGEQGEDADDRLEVFYTCLGLGFTGMFKGEPDTLHDMLPKVAARLRGRMDTDENAKICPETYKYTMTRELELPVGSYTGYIAAATVVLLILAFVVNGTLYKVTTSKFQSLLPPYTESGQ